MKILLVLPYVPYPVDSGGKRRISNILKQLSRENELFIFSLSEREYNKNDLENLKNLSKTIHIFYPEQFKINRFFSSLFSNEPVQLKYFKSLKMKNAINLFLNNNKVDLIFVEEIHINNFVKDISNIPKILSRQKVESSYLKELGNFSHSFIKNLYFKNQAKKFYNFEIESYKNYKKILVPANEDKDYITSQGVDSENIEIIPNGVDTEYFSFQKHKIHTPPVFLFNGSFNYLPNIDAVNYFLKNIYPILRYELGTFKFFIVGRYGKEKFYHLKNFYPEIEITGFVDDIREYLYNADLFLCPLRIGGGTRLKILEAMSCGLPVVTTRVGCEGLGTKHRENIIAEDNKDKFVKEIINILNDNKLYLKISKNAREFIENNFSWNIIGKNLNEIINSINEI